MPAHREGFGESTTRNTKQGVKGINSPSWADLSMPTTVPFEWIQSMESVVGKGEGIDWLIVAEFFASVASAQGLEEGLSEDERRSIFKFWIRNGHRF